MRSGNALRAQVETIEGFDRGKPDVGEGLGKDVEAMDFAYEEVNLGGVVG